MKQSQKNLVINAIDHYIGCILASEINGTEEEIDTLYDAIDVIKKL